MDADRYQRLRRLVHAAADIPAAEREAWLRSQAPHDASLVQRALALLSEPGEATAAMALAPSADEALPQLRSGLALGAYVLGAELGRGGMGVVFEARAADAAAPVALKVIHPHLLATPGARERFRREARLGLAIDHPNVVRTLDVGESDVGGLRLAWLVMERVHGRTFRRLVDELSALPEAWARELVAQAAEGLAALHDAGAVHRDLKPENLILTDDRRVRVMDLGVAKLGSESVRLTREGLFLGSPAYAAPEQCEGLPVGPAADLYALGVVLFELASGRPPFEGKEPLALLRAHVEEPAPSLVSRNPAVSPLLDELVRVLLAKRPERRLASARELAQVLHEGESGAWWTTHAEAARRSGRGRPRAAVPLVGREHELAALREEWRAARAGHGGVVLVEAEAGLGASRLVGELVAEAQARGHLVLHGSAESREAGEGPFAALVEHLGQRDLAQTLALRLELDAAPAQALAVCLTNPLAPSPSPAGGSVEGLLARLARSIAATAPVLWVIEDVHGLPAEVRRGLAALARAAQGHALLLVLTTRPGLDPGLRAALGALPAFRALDLPRLDEEAMARLFEAAVGDVGLGRRLARELGPRADGVPLFALELLRELERRRALVRGPDGRLSEAATPVPDAAPRALLDLVRARLADVPDALRGVLEAASVAGREVDPDVLTRALARPRIEVLEALVTLERRHALLRSGPRTFRFDHALVQETVYRDLPQALRAALHDRLAEACAGPEGAEQPSGRVAHHRLRGAAPAAAWPYVERTLTHLAAQRREAERLALVREALAAERAVQGVRRYELLLEASVHSRETGRHAECEAMLEEAEAWARAVPDARREARVFVRRANDALQTAEFAKAERFAARALSLLETAGSSSAIVDALTAQAKAWWLTGRTAEALRGLEQALARARALGAPGTVALAQGNLAILLQELGRPQEAEAHQREGLATLRQGSDTRNLCSALGDLANTLVVQGRLAEARPLYEEALGMARRGGFLELESVVLVNLGELRLRLGDLAGARQTLDACLRGTQEIGARRVEAYALHGLGMVEAWSGQRLAARRRFEEAVRVRRAIANRSALAESLLQLGALDAQEGAADAARARLDEALELARAADDPSTVVLATIVRASLPGGDASAARALFAARRGALRGDALLESLTRLSSLTGDPADLAAARAALENQLTHLAPEDREAFLGHVPYARAVAAGLPPPAGAAV